MYIRSLFSSNNFVVFCNVGQGDAAYMRMDNADILIDTGPDKSVFVCLGKYMQIFDKTIEHVIISHPQKDHIGSLDTLLRTYNIENIYIGQPEKTKNWLRIYAGELEKKNTKIHYVSQNDILIHQSFKLIFLWPPHNTKSTEDNDLSLVNMIITRQVRILFTGDLSLISALHLIKTTDVKTDILKVPHHGSGKSISSSFLRLAQPTIAVISVGRKNPHGHPSKQTLDLLKALKITVRRTDEEGDVKINF